MAETFIPRNYQKLGAEWMLTKPRSGLFMDMGLGKTAVALTVINYLVHMKKEVKKCLIIAPKRVIDSVWQQEAQKWEHTKHLTFSKVMGSVAKRKKALETPADVYLISRDFVSWLCGLYGGNMLPFDMIVIDESSSFKNHSSTRTKALHKATANVPRITLLTGTPSPNGLVNLWPQLYLLDRGERLGRTITEFRREYLSQGRPVADNVYQWHVSKRAEADILHKISDLCISMQSKDLIELPECVFNYINIDLPEEAENAYKLFRKHSILQLMAEKENEVQNARKIAEAMGVEFDPMSIYVTALSAAALSNKCLQVANGAVYYNDQHDWLPIHDAKIEALKEMVEDLDGSGQNILVAYSFKHDKERILKALKSYKPRELKGDKEVTDWNKGKVKVMLAHPASAGHGLNLQYGGHHSCWFGLPWDLELYEQFNKRTHRSGQDQRVFIHHLIAAGTEDERVVKRLKEKGDVQSALLEGLSEEIKRLIS